MPKKDSEFGGYVKQLRKRRQMSQEQLADRLGRKKMTVSLWETGGNDPPQGAMLREIAKILCDTEQEQVKLYKLASKARKTLPSEIVDMCLTHPSLFDLLLSPDAAQYTDQEWQEAARYLKNERRNNAENGRMLK